MITFTTSEIAIFRKTKSVIINVALVFSVLMFTNISIQARGAPESFADLAEKLSPSVVNITTSTTIAGVNDQARPQIPEGSPFEIYSRISLIMEKVGKEGQEEVVL